MKIISFLIDALILALILPVLLLWLIWYILKGVFVLFQMFYFAVTEHFKQLRQC